MLDVNREIVLSASPETVWALMGPFGSIDTWHPAIADCQVDGAGQGAKRHLTLGNGAYLKEERTDNGENPHAYSYKIVEGPLPIAHYQATLSVMPSGGDTLVRWHGYFEANGVSDKEASDIVAGVYEAGLNAMADMLDA